MGDGDLVFLRGVANSQLGKLGGNGRQRREARFEKHPGLAKLRLARGVNGRLAGVVPLRLKRRARVLEEEV